MEQKQLHILNYLKDMFGSKFDSDVIECVLMQRNWNVDQAVDDLMTMSSGNVFTIPLEDTDFSSDLHFNDQNCFTQSNASCFAGPYTNNQDDGVVILEEEEYVVSSDSDEVEPLPQEVSQMNLSAAPIPNTSYASMAQKPASKNAVQQSHVQVSSSKPPFQIYQGYTSYDRIKRTRDSIERVKLHVQNRFKIMVILRGCPGSGKSSLAQNILKECKINSNPLLHIHSSDNYFCLNPTGKYQFNKEKLSEAHGWNQANVLHVIREGLTPIIIDNTNTRMWEMKAYALMAVCAGYEIEIIEPDTVWAFNVTQLVQKNIHGVAKAQLLNMFDGYEHNISATTLIKHFQLEYAPSQYPPQEGVITLSNPKLLETFERIHYMMYVLPEKFCQPVNVEVRKSKKQRKKERRRKRIMSREVEPVGFVELDKLTETDSADSNRDLDTDEDIAEVQEYELDRESSESVMEESNDNEDGNDSDPSWLTIDEDESIGECSEIENNERASVSSSVESTSQNVGKKCTKIEGNGADKCDVRSNVSSDADIFCVPDIPNKKPKSGLRIRNELKNPPSMVPEIIDLTADLEESHFAENKNKDNYDPIQIDSCINQVLNSVLGITTDENKKATSNEATKPKITNDNVIVDQVLNNALELTPDQSFSDVVPSTVEVEENELLSKNLESFIRNKSIPTDTVTSELLEKSIDSSGAELVVTKKLDDNSNLIKIQNHISTLSKTPPLSIETSADSKVNIPSKTVEKSSESQTSSNLCTAFVTDMNWNDRLGCNEDKRPLLVETPRKIIDNIHGVDSKKLKLCNIEGQKNSSGDAISNAACSYKFKEDSSKNVIANDLWGKTNERNSEANDEKEMSDDNSDNTISRSNSSSSDELAITDVHNTSNRFVNNDINNDQGERKKANINRAKKNQNVASDCAENVWGVTDSTVPELNTLKERILINSLDKIFNPPQNSEPPLEIASTSAILDQRDKKQVNLAHRSTTAFQIIENKLRDERRVDSASKGGSPCSSRSEDFEDALDNAESKYWNQWVRGENWDDNTKDQEFKKSDADAKPQRKVSESSPKQKNTETVANIRLVNDIRNASDNSKMCLLLDKKNKNQDSAFQQLKSTNFQSQFWRDRTSPHSLNKNQRVPSKEDNIESDFESKSKNFRLSEDLFESQRKSQTSRAYSGFFKNFNANDSQSRPELTDNASLLRNVSPDALKECSSVDCRSPRSQKSDSNSESLDNLMSRHRNLSRDENSSDFEKSVLKWSPVSEVSLRLSKVERQMLTQDATESMSGNFFIPEEILNLERNKATNTGLDDNAEAMIIKIGRCREINKGRSSPQQSYIEQSYKCDKSTMTDGSNYTVKAKPMREDLSNIFPAEMVDVLLDLYEKCNGNMDWIIEILLEDGYSPSDDQLEYLSSLQNVLEYRTCETIEKDKKISEKKKIRNKNSRSNGNNAQNIDKKDFMKRRKVNANVSDTNEPNSSEESDSVSEENVDLFLDWSTVSQLMEYFGNPTVYSIRDYQPTVKLPLSLARQLHAYLISSIIDQEEENEDIINQLTEEDKSVSSYLQNSNFEELSQNDVSEVEVSLSDILKVPFDLSGKKVETTEEDHAASVQRESRNEDSFASKLSLNLLYRAFPTVDSSFVRSTFKSQNFNYHDTKNILNQYSNEVPIDHPQGNASKYDDMLGNDDEMQLFEAECNSANSGNEIADQVLKFRKSAALNQRQWQKCHENLREAVQQKRFGVASYYSDIMNVFKQKFNQNNAHAAALLINSSCMQNSDMIDLHYFKVTDALKALDKFLDERITKLMSSRRSKMVLFVITGRGARSTNGVSRLQPPVKNRLKRRNIDFEVEPHNPGLIKAIIRNNSLVSADL